MAIEKVTTEAVEDNLKVVSAVLILNQPIASTLPIMLDWEVDITITSIIVKSSTGTIVFSLTVEGGAADAAYTSKTITTTKTAYTANQDVDAGESTEIVLSSPSSPGIISIQVNGVLR